MRLLVVEDEAKIARALRDGLLAAEFEVEVAHTGEDGLFLVIDRQFDLVVLDVMLPGRSGLELLAAMRRQGLQVPVLVLTARDAVEDRVLGLNAGADDYLIKPFAFAELLARVRALLRRGRLETAVCFQAADLEMDVVRRHVTRAGAPVELTAREFELLSYLLRHKNQLVSREMLARDVWKESRRGPTLDNLIDVHIARLRKKVDRGEAPRLIHTVRGVGFMLREDDP